MDYTTILTELENTSLFEIYRLEIAIHQQLNDPVRLGLIKSHLKTGQLIDYFDETENRLIEATIVELKRTKVLVKDKHDGKLWNIPYYYININNSDIEIQATAKLKTSRNNLKVGDNVYFKDKKGNELFGEVVKLNTKTAGVLVGETKWRVDYSFLSTIIDGELGGNQKLLECEVIVEK